MTVIENAIDMKAYLEALVSGRAAVNEGLNPPDTLTGEALADYLRSCRNRALAGDGLKAAFLGTLETSPTVTIDELKARGIKDTEAQMLIDERDAIRTAALALIA